MYAEDERADWGDEAAGEPGSTVDRIVDDLLPGDFDWREMVRSYPISAIALAAVGGFLIGSRHGSELLEELQDFVDREVSRNIQTVFGDESSPFGESSRE